MRNLLFFLLGPILALVGGLASAATINVTWQNATEYTDGTVMAAGDLAGVRVEYGKCASPGVWGTKIGETFANAPSTSVQVTFNGWGDICVRGFTKTKATALVPNAESVASNVAFKLIPTPAPKPPVLTTVENFVYELDVTGSRAVKLAQRVGTVAFGVPCGEIPVVQRGGRTYYEVSPEHVSFKRAPNSAIVVAHCGAA